MAIVERKFEFAGTRVELLSLLQGESDQRRADFLQQRPGLRARDVWLLSAQWRGRPVETLDSIRFYPLSALHPVDVPDDVLALLGEGQTVELTFGGPPRGPVTVIAVCHHESFMPWFRVVLRLLGQEEDKSDGVSVSASSPVPDTPPIPGRNGYTWDDVFDWWYRGGRLKYRTLKAMAESMGFSAQAVWNCHAQYKEEYGESPMPDGQSKYAGSRSKS